MEINIYILTSHQVSTYDHRIWKTRDPVRSPIDKPNIARSVVGSVTTSESLVLYVFAILFDIIPFSTLFYLGSRLFFFLSNSIGEYQQGTVAYFKGSPDTNVVMNQNYLELQVSKQGIQFG
ncbi:hypothetical protein F4804DRAFT_122859 [Jackrogersella minutella]|nr:hypothetical protein F4804DRAFT_122859 [Jackrogersella minutella]